MNAVPDSSAVRTALWRALHVEVDAPPHLLEDEIGLALADPEPRWRERPDMHPVGTAGYRAALVARTRFVEDLLVDERVSQYVLLGAGLDTFAQRHPELAERVHVFEIDQPGPQTWKRQRLEQLGYGVPANLHLVPVDLETDDDWSQPLIEAGFDATAKTLASSSGVSMYITEDATAHTLQQLARMAPGSTVAMTFMLPFELADETDRPGLEAAAKGARASGTPWVSFYTPEQMLALAGGTDGLHAASGEAVLLARTLTGGSGHPSAR